jgi:hypothetical protein
MVMKPSASIFRKKLMTLMSFRLWQAQQMRSDHVFGPASPTSSDIGCCDKLSKPPESPQCTGSYIQATMKSLAIKCGQCVGRQKADYQSKHAYIE